MDTTTDTVAKDLKRMCRFLKSRTSKFGAERFAPRWQETENAPLTYVHDQSALVGTGGMEGQTLR